MRKSWIGCVITSGQFPEEYAVSISTVNDGMVSFFVPRYSKLIRRGPKSFEDAIQVIVIDEDKDNLLINLPLMPLENVGRTVVVSKVIDRNPTGVNIDEKN